MVKVLLKRVHNFVTILRADSKFRDHGLNSLLKRMPPIDGKNVKNSTDHIWCQKIALKETRETTRTRKREIVVDERQQTQETLMGKTGER